MTDATVDPVEDEVPAEGAARAASPWALALGPALFAAALLVPLPDLEGKGGVVAATTSVRAVLGLTLWMAAWWMTEAVPLAVTSLLPLAVLPASGVASARSVTPTYFDETIALFLGGFLLSLAMEHSGLHRRFAHAVVRAAGTGARRLVLGFLLASGLVSMWVSNTATALMLMPVATTVVRAVLPPPAARSDEHRRFAACVVLAVAYGASLGGVGTLVGTPPNMIFRGFVEQRAGEGLAPVTFGRWLVVGVPLVAVLLPTAWLLLVRVALPVRRDLPLGARDEVVARLAPAGRATRDERVVLATFVAAALLWVTREAVVVGGVRVPLTGWAEAFTHPVRGGRPEAFVRDSTVAIAGALVLFLVPSGVRRGARVLPWAYAARRMPWGALLLFGGGFALAEAFRPSGLGDYLAAAFGGLSGLPAWAVLLVVAFGIAAISEVASNTATITMMLPVLHALAHGIGTDPLPILLVGTLAASCGFMLPVATVANAIAYGTGEATARQMARAGLWLDVVGVLVMVAAVLLLSPLVFG